MSWKFVVRKKSSKKKKGPEFKVQLRTYRKDLIEEHRKRHPSHKSQTVEKDLPQAEWERYGFFTNMSLEEAQIRKDELNAQSKEEDEREARVKRISRLKREEQSELAFLSPYLVHGFEEKLRRDYRLLNDQKWAKNKIHSHWRKAKEIVLELKLDISDWDYNAQRFYDAFVDRKYSYSYVSKLIQILNKWGVYVSRVRNKFYSPIPLPKNTEKSRIEDEYYLSDKKSKESDPLTISVFEEGKLRFKKEEHRNWIFISQWFGLRPMEVDLLRDAPGKLYTIEEMEGHTVLRVNQPKLKSISFDKRWKLIPILYPEQKKALEIIKSGDFSRPHSKTVQRAFGDQFNTYAGRKGFVDLMQGRGHPLEAISSWLGHTNVDRTWKDYRNKKKVHLG